MPARLKFPCGISDYAIPLKFVLLRQINRYYSLFQAQKQRRAPALPMMHQINAILKMINARFRCVQLVLTTAFAHFAAAHSALH